MQRWGNGMTHFFLIQHDQRWDGFLASFKHKVWQGVALMTDSAKKSIVDGLPLT